MNCQWEISHNRSSWEFGRPLQRNGRFSSKWIISDLPVILAQSRDARTISVGTGRFDSWHSGAALYRMYVKAFLVKRTLQTSQLRNSV